MAIKETRRIDISEIRSNPDLVRLAEEVQKTRTPCILRQDNEDIVQITPIRPPNKGRLKGRPTSKDDSIWNIIGIADDPTDEATDVSENKKKYLAEAYWSEFHGPNDS